MANYEECKGQDYFCEHFDNGNCSVDTIECDYKKKVKHLKVYLAGGIFTLGDELRNKYFADKLRREISNIDLYSPIENTAINGIEGKKKFAGSELIEKADNERLDNTDILIACIDGDVLPSGTCSEIGIFREKIRRGDHKYIVGICTDNRECSRTHSMEKDRGGAAGICESQYSYQNLYVVGCIKSSGVLVSNIDDAIAFIKKVAPEFSESGHGKIVDILTVTEGNLDYDVVEYEDGYVKKVGK